MDQSVLLLSMVVAAGLEGRLVAVSKSASAGHMLPEIWLADRAPSETVERLSRHSTPDGWSWTRTEEVTYYEL